MHNTILGKHANAKFLVNRHNTVPGTHVNIFCLINRHNTIPGKHGDGICLVYRSQGYIADWHVHFISKNKKTAAIHM